MLMTMRTFLGLVMLLSFLVKTMAVTASLTAGSDATVGFGVFVFCPLAWIIYELTPLQHFSFFKPAGLKEKVLGSQRDLSLETKGVPIDEITRSTGFPIEEYACPTLSDASVRDLLGADVVDRIRPQHALQDEGARVEGVELQAGKSLSRDPSSRQQRPRTLSATPTEEVDGAAWWDSPPASSAASTVDFVPAYRANSAEKASVRVELEQIRSNPSSPAYTRAGSTLPRAGSTLLASASSTRPQSVDQAGDPAGDQVSSKPPPRPPVKLILSSGPSSASQTEAACTQQEKPQAAISMTASAAPLTPRSDEELARTQTIHARAVSTKLPQRAGEGLAVEGVELNVSSTAGTGASPASRKLPKVHGTLYRG
uniref:Uncharacterized protein n=1 Tax=Haptolina ericina TaxID=156174 RepID=A0A7S3B5F5_9EUKA